MDPYTHAAIAVAALYIFYKIGHRTGLRDGIKGTIMGLVDDNIIRLVTNNAGEIIDIDKAR